jgi:hypothetical protein
MSEDIYSNQLAEEFLPGVMYPFHWSVLAGMVDASWCRISRDLRVEGGEVQFVRTFYHHAYWNITKISAMLKVAGLPQTVLDRLFEAPFSRELEILDEASVDRVLTVDRSTIVQDLEQSILESERRIEEVQRKKGDRETEDEIVRELDLIIDIIGEVIFRETSAWLLVGLNLSLLDEWTGHQKENRRKRSHPADTVQLPESKLEEVRSMANRYRSHWELSRMVRTIGKGLAEERLYELGERFVKWNLLRIKEDVRYLTVHEVRQIVSGGCATNTCNNYALRARVRRTEIDEHSVGELPPFIKGEVAPLLPWKKE